MPSQVNSRIFSLTEGKILTLVFVRCRPETIQVCPVRLPVVVDDVGDVVVVDYPLLHLGVDRHRDALDLRGEKLIM